MVRVPVVLDCGGSAIKYGYANDERPSVVPLTDDATTLERRGDAIDWESLEALWRELPIRLHGQHVVLVQPFNSTPADCGHMTRILFESFHVAGLYIGHPAVLMAASTAAAAATSKQGDAFSGVVVDVGDGGANTVAVSEGCVIRSSARRLHVGGRDLTQRMAQMLVEAGSLPVPLGPAAGNNIAIAKDIKEQYGYVSLDYDNDLDKSAVSTLFDLPYTLPDGRVVNIGSERFRCPEMLFSHNIHAMAYESSMALLSPQAPTGSTFLISGGSSLFLNFSCRLRNELKALASAKNTSEDVTVVAPRDRKDLAWIGGAQLSSKAETDLWVTDKDYVDAGSGVVYRKFASVF